MISETTKGVRAGLLLLFLISVSDYASDQLHHSRISQCPYRFPPTRSIRPVSLRTLICFCMIRRVTPNLSPNASCETPGCSFNISIILSTIASSKAPCFVVFRCFGALGRSIRALSSALKKTRRPCPRSS